MERILCAAIWYDNAKVNPHQPKNIHEGLVICGRRHHNCIATYYALTGKGTTRGTSVQGFLTSDDKFVTRGEAHLIALAAGQIALGNTHDGDMLDSCDLY